MFSESVRDRLDAALLAVTDSDLRSAVIEVFEMAHQRAREDETDVVVLAARRLACVYQLLVDAGMPKLDESCAVISDRFLDVPGDWEWRKVLILDDSVVVGTTLLRLHDRIAERIAPGGQVSSLTACLDENQYAQYLVDAVHLEERRRRPTADVEQFSRQLVETLFAGGVPFFSDYPMTTSIELSAQEWDAYLSGDRWHVADVTAPLFASVPRRTFAHIPTDATSDNILRRLPPSVARLVEAMKIRSYFAEHADGSVTTRFVPIAMLAPSTPDEMTVALDDAVKAIAPRMDYTVDPAGLQWQRWEQDAKHRLIQMYVATCVLDEALSFTNVKWHLDDVQIKLYFHRHYELADSLRAAIVAEFHAKSVFDDIQPAQAVVANTPRPSWILETDVVQRVLWANSELLSETARPKQPDAGQLTRVGLVFGHAVASVFGFINSVFELDQRREIRELNDVAAYRKRYPKGNLRRVLSQGITLRELTTALLPDTLGGSSWNRGLMSLAIDIGNDLGIIVPVTRHDTVRDVVYRAYRLGETAAIASTPLPDAAQTQDWDPYARAAEKGFPIDSETMGIRQIAPAVDASPPELMARLREEVREAVPGAVVSQADGEVVEVDGPEFTIQFVDPLDERISIMIIPKKQLSVVEQAHLVRGAIVKWILFETGKHARDLTSRVRLRNEPPWDPEQLKRDTAAFSFLGEAS